LMVMPDLGTAHPAEKFLGPIRTSLARAIRLLVIDPAHLETSAQVIPALPLVGMDDGALGDPI
jgi:hypothetical protein